MTSTTLATILFTLACILTSAAFAGAGPKTAQQFSATDYIHCQTDLHKAKAGHLGFTDDKAKPIRAALRHSDASLASSLGAAEPGSRVTVFVYNYAGAPPDVLALTEAEASRIYQQAGIQIQWLECPLAPKDADQFPACQVPPGPTKLALRILSRSMADRLRQAEDSFGFAMIPENGSFATLANVFSYDADQLADRRSIRLGVILGHLAAHELGHLLLGAGSHSSHGIMHVPWRLKELDVIAQGLMVFTPQQTESMRTNIRARGARERATEEAPAPRTASPETGLNIEIHVYNYSAASGDLLGRAEQEASRIFRRTGVATAWLSCPLASEEAVRNKACALPDAPTRLTLRLLSNSMADTFGVSGDVFGSALLPENEGFGVVANVYADRARELADRREFEVILGRVMAHELGHLLLGKNAHSAAGIMQARWRDQDLRFSRQAAMLFLPREAKRIRANVRARAGHKPASEPSAAIAVRVYRLAQVPPSTLARAEAEAGKMFQQAGIEISWFHCGRTDNSIKDQAICSEPAGPAKPVLRILSCFRPEPGVTAETVGFANISARIANISFDRVSELMPYIAAPRSSVLGLVVAHEIGHLLLQVNGHSPVGIMHFPWSPKELGLANHNFLVFTAKEARTMRARMRSSKLDQPSTPEPEIRGDRQRLGG